MQVTTISNFRKDLKNYIEQVSKKFETLIIHHGNDEDVVLISLKEYNSLMETLYITSSKKNMERLDTSIANLESGNSKVQSLVE